ncbi:hypothetical protein CI102_13004 [Trichoderma harzianum]|nr:hypothetical protein CI102_13004 [Trichoderma harzianum]
MCCMVRKKKSAIAILNAILSWALNERVILPFFPLDSRVIWQTGFCPWRVTSQLSPIVLHTGTGGGGRSPELPIPYSRIFIPVHQSTSNSGNNHLLIEPMNRLCKFVLFRLRIFCVYWLIHLFFALNFGTNAAGRSHLQMTASV